MPKQKKNKLILLVIADKFGQKRITIPKSSKIKGGQYVEVKKV